MRKSGEPEKKLGLIDIGGGDWRGQLMQQHRRGLMPGLPGISSTGPLHKMF